MKIQKHIDALKKILGVEVAKRALARRRTKTFHKQQLQAEKQCEAAHDAADRLQKEGHLAKSRRKTNKALKLENTAKKKCAKSVYWRGVARQASQNINKVNTSLDKAEKELAKYNKTHGPHIDKATRKVVGTTDKGEAAIYAAIFAWHECAAGHRPNYYSMTGGGFNVTHCVAKGSQKSIGQVPYERSDCSVFVTEVCYAAGLPDPNGAKFGSGYTGTLVGEHEGWKNVSYAEMAKKGWGYIVYGGGVGHHTEFFIGNGRTIGHGSAPVDPGVPDLFGDGDFRCYIYDPS